MKLTFLVSCATILAHLASPGTAAAIGACTCTGNGFAVPDFGAVPINGRIFAVVPQQDPMSARLRCGEGVEIPVDVTPAGGAGYRVWVQPRTNLLAGSQCSLTFTGGSTVPDGGPGPVGRPLTINFQVSDIVDETPPTVASVKVTPGGLTSDCGSGPPGAYLIVKGFEDDVPAYASVLVQVDVTGPGDPQRLFAAVSSSDLRVAITGAAESFDGTGIDCAAEYRLRGGKPGVTYTADVTVWDRAGNSTVVRGVTFALSDPSASSSSQGGCTMAGRGADGVAVMLVGLGLLLGGRRWRRGRHLGRGG